MATANPPRKFIPSGLVMRRIVNPITVRLGGPTLVVRGRRTGRMRSVPLPAFHHAGASYLVGGRGEAHWVRNLRAAGEAEYRERGRRQRFQPLEVSGEERDSVLAAYRAHYGRRVAAMFTELPDADQHPVFRIEPLPGGPARPS